MDGKDAVAWSLLALYFRRPRRRGCGCWCWCCCCSKLITLAHMKGKMSSVKGKNWMSQICECGCVCARRHKKACKLQRKAGYMIGDKIIVAKEPERKEKRVQTTRWSVNQVDIWHKQLPPPPLALCVLVGAGTGSHREREREKEKERERKRQKGRRGEKKKNKQMANGDRWHFHSEKADTSGTQVPFFGMFICFNCFTLSLITFYPPPIAQVDVSRSASFYSCVFNFCHFHWYLVLLPPLSLSLPALSNTTHSHW